MRTTLVGGKVLSRIYSKLQITIVDTSVLIFILMVYPSVVIEEVGDLSIVDKDGSNFLGQHRAFYMIFICLK